MEGEVYFCQWHPHVRIEVIGPRADICVRCETEREEADEEEYGLRCRME